MAVEVRLLLMYQLLLVIDELEVLKLLDDLYPDIQTDLLETTDLLEIRQ